MTLLMAWERQRVREGTGSLSLVLGSREPPGAHPRAAPALAARWRPPAARRVAAGSRPILAGATLISSAGPPRLGPWALPLITPRPGGRAHPVAAARLSAQALRERTAAALRVGPRGVSVPIRLLLVVVEDRLVGVVAGRTPRPHRRPAGLHRPGAAPLIATRLWPVRALTSAPRRLRSLTGTAGLSGPLALAAALWLRAAVRATPTPAAPGLVAPSL